MKINLLFETTFAAFRALGGFQHLDTTAASSGILKNRKQVNAGDCADK